MKPTLYLALDGPVLVPDAHPEAALGTTKIVEYAAPFVHWAKDHFNVVWLTERSPGEAFYVAHKLGLPRDAVPVAGFTDSKVDAIRAHEPFVWMDAELTPTELQWLGQHQLHTQFVQVDPLKGVTPDHKLLIEKLIPTLKRM